MSERNNELKARIKKPCKAIVCRTPYWLPIGHVWGQVKPKFSGVLSVLLGEYVFSEETDERGTPIRPCLASMEDRVNRRSKCHLLKPGAVAHSSCESHTASVIYIQLLLVSDVNRLCQSPVSFDTAVCVNSCRVV